MDTSPETLQTLTNPDMLQSMGAVAAGLGLSAAAGFRVFIPLLVMAIAGKFSPETLPLGESFQWLASWPTILMLSVATLAEIAGYYLPWVDNLLDSIATPAALASGTLISAAVMPEMNEGVKWALAAIAGGGSAGIIQTGSVLLRGLSTATTGGLANPILSTTEAGGSITTSLLALMIPLFLIVVLFILFAIIIYKVVTRKPQPPAPALADGKT